MQRVQADASAHRRFGTQHLVEGDLYDQPGAQEILLYISPCDHGVREARSFRYACAITDPVPPRH